jgi:hypothetical protein
LWSERLRSAARATLYDNALAETVIGLFRLLAPLGYVPPAAFQQAYHDRQAAPACLAVLT